LPPSQNNPHRRRRAASAGSLSVFTTTTMREIPKAFWAVAAYLVVTFVAVIVPGTRFLPDVVIAPLYVVLPTGIGLLVVAPVWKRSALAAWLPHGLALAAAAFIGLVAITYVYLLVNTVVWLEPVYLRVYLLLHAASLAGYWVGRSLLIADADMRVLGTHLLLALPFAALSYWFYYLQFASPPLRDVFQEVHFIKGAMEIARYGFYNPMASALSYIPLLQFNFAQLHRFYGYDLLNAQWLQPWVMFPLHFVAYRALVGSLIQDTRVQAIAMVLMAGTLQPMLFSVNGSLQLSMCVLLLGLLIRNPAARGPGAALALTMSMVVLLGLYMGLVHLDFERVAAGWSVAACALPLAALLAGRSSLLVIAFLLFFCVTAFTVHRGIILFLPSILFAYVAYAVTMALGGRVRDRSKIAIVISLAAGTLLLLVPQWIHALLSKMNVVENDASVKYALAELMGRFGFDAQIVAANSALVSLAEWLRQVPVYAHLALAVLALWFLAHFRRGEQPANRTAVAGASTRLAEADLPFYLGAMLIVYVAVALSPVPFAYRGLYFPALFMAMALAWLLIYCLDAATDELRARRQRWLIVGTLGYLTISSFALYGYDFTLSRNANSYLDASAANLKALLAAAVVLAVVCFFIMNRALATATIAALIALASHIDKVTLTAYLYPYSYRAELPADGVISHYAAEELAAADRMSELGYNTVLVSDPYTLGIFRARTGLNGLYSYANLDTLHKIGTDMLRESLDYALHGQRSAASPQDFTEGVVKRLVFFMHRAGASAEVSHGYLCHMERVLNGRNAGRDVVLVVTSRTQAWVAGEPSYYPNLKRFSSDYIARDIAPYYRIVQNIDDKVLVLRLRQEHLVEFKERSIWEGKPLMQTPAMKLPETFSREARCRSPREPVPLDY
jgi:hypothetical protein